VVTYVLSLVTFSDVSSRKLVFLQQNISCDIWPSLCLEITRAFTHCGILEMGKHQNSAGTNQTRTHVLPTTGLNSNTKVRNVQEPVKNQTEPDPKCCGSYSVLLLNDIVGPFTHFNSKQGTYFNWANQIQVEVKCTTFVFSRLACTYNYS